MRDFFWLVLLHNSSLALYFVLLLFPLLSSISPSLACLSFGNNGLYAWAGFAKHTIHQAWVAVCRITSLTPCTITWHALNTRQAHTTMPSEASGASLSLPALYPVIYLHNPFTCMSAFISLFLIVPFFISQHWWMMKRLNVDMVKVFSEMFHDLWDFQFLIMTSYFLLYQLPERIICCPIYISQYCN